MTIFVENDSEIIVYTLEKIIAFARSNQYIFLAQSVWWISSVWGLQAGIIIHVDNIRTRSEILSLSKNDLARTRESKKDDDLRQQDTMLTECEEYLHDSRRLRRLAAVITKGITRSRRINPLASTKDNLTVGKKKNDLIHSQTVGIEEAEIKRRKGAGECLRCAWPFDQKGGHGVAQCRREIKLDSRTARHLKALQITLSAQVSSHSLSDIWKKI